MTMIMPHTSCLTFPTLYAPGPAGTSCLISPHTLLSLPRRYLMTMEPRAMGLMERHAAWILKVDPEAGLEAFLHLKPPLDPRVVLPILEAHAPRLQSQYLEGAMRLGIASVQDFHTELLLIYLQVTRGCLAI